MSKLQASLARRGHKTLYPTPALCRYWLRVLNTEVFDGQLPMPTDVVIGTEQAWAAAAVFADDTSWVLEFSHERRTFRVFIDILAHEAVHAMVHLVDKVSLRVTHGPPFMSYKSLLSKHGIKLKRGGYG